MVVLDNHIDYREGTAVEAVPVAFFAAVVPLTDTAAVAAAEDRARELHSLTNRNLDLLRALVADNRVLRSELQHERRRTAEAECAPLGRCMEVGAARGSATFPSVQPRSVDVRCGVIAHNSISTAFGCERTALLRVNVGPRTT